MEVQFRRTGERRYAVTIYRQALPPVEMNPAPGYDPWMPHDLLHLVVESELGLRQGIFGQLAQGGHAGTFHLVSAGSADRRQLARQRKRAAKRGDKLMRAGQQEAALSERATYCCLYEWLARSTDPARRKRAVQMAAEAQPLRAATATAEDRALTPDFIRRVCARLDELSTRWASLGVGQALSLEWPERA